MWFYQIRPFKIIMQLLTQYDLSCISIGFLHIYYQSIVCVFIKYDAVHRASNKKSESKFDILSRAGMLFKIFLSSLLCNQEATIFVYDWATVITFVVLDCFTIEFSEVRLSNAHMQRLSNRPSESFMTFIAFA